MCKHSYVKIILPVLLFFLLTVPPAWAGLVETGPLTQDVYWLRKDGPEEALVLSASQLTAYNRRVQEAGLGVSDMRNFPDHIPAEEVRRRVSDMWVLNRRVYCRGEILTDAEKGRIRANGNLQALKDSPAELPVKWGVTVRYTAVRNLPLAEGLFYEPGDIHYDQVQDSALAAGEPVAVLHTSRDGRYYFVKLYNLYGWIAREDIALCSRSHWEKYADPEDFLIVADRSFSVRVNDEDVFYLMGSRLRLLQGKNGYWQISLPYKDNATERLRETFLWLAETKALHQGYLPYSPAQVIRQAFKFYGSEYGWGGLDHKVDCSSLVDAVYASVGLRLPRNSGALRMTPGYSVDFTGADTSRRLALLRTLQPGAVLSLPGHVMLYLGMENGVPYVLHGASSYYKDGRKIYVRRVVVSDLSLGRSDGRTFLESLLNAVEYR